MHQKGETSCTRKKGYEPQTEDGMYDLHEAAKGNLGQAWI